MKADELKAVMGAVGINLDTFIGEAIEVIKEEDMKYYVLYRPRDGMYLYYTLGPESPAEVHHTEWIDSDWSSVTDVLLNLMSSILVGDKDTQHAFYDVCADLIGVMIGDDIFAVPNYDGELDFTKAEKLIDGTKQYGYV